MQNEKLKMQTTPAPASALFAFGILTSASRLL
jgi:hypothetical protein